MQDGTGRGLLALAATVIGLTGLPTGAAAQGPMGPPVDGFTLCGSTMKCARASADGRRVAFSTHDRLVQDDDETSTDVYLVIDAKRTILLTGPNAVGKQHPFSTLKAISRDGTRVLVDTQHSYDPQDNDPIPLQDLYVVGDEQSPELVTQGGSSLAPDPLILVGWSGDLRHVLLFNFYKDIFPGDVNGADDLFEWTGGAHRLVTTGPMATPTTTGGGNSAVITEDGSRIFFTHSAAITADDADSDSDVFVRENGATTLVPIPGDPADASPYGTNPDGSHLVFGTSEQLDPADTDANQDIYDLSGGTLTLVSRGQIGGNDAGPECGGPPPNNCYPFFNGISRAGDRIFFDTRERLVPEDLDAAKDLYERSGGTTKLISIGTTGGDSGQRQPAFEGISGDGSAVAFTTLEKLLPSDTDGYSDIYVRRGGATELIPTGPVDPREGPEAGPAFAAFSEDGRSVIFMTSAGLVAGDNDNGDTDVYARIGVAKGTPGKSATASGKRKKGKGKRRKAITKLISAERIPPRITIGAHGRTRGGSAQVRIGCPKREESGSCSGKAAAAGGGSGAFKVKRGRSVWVTVGSASALGGAASVTVKAKDALGNRARARKRVRF